MPSFLEKLVESRKRKRMEKLLSKMVHCYGSLEEKLDAGQIELLANWIVENVHPEIQDDFADFVRVRTIDIKMAKEMAEQFKRKRVQEIAERITIKD